MIGLKQIGDFLQEMFNFGVIEAAVQQFYLNAFAAEYIKQPQPPQVLWP